MKKHITALFAAAAFAFSAVNTVSAAVKDIKSVSASVKGTVLLGEKPADISDVNGDGTVNVLDLMRLKYRYINPAAEPDTPAGKFVYGLYRDVLGIDADQDEMDTLTQKLEKKEISAADAVLDFLGRQEFADRQLTDEEYLDAVCRALLGHEADDRYEARAEELRYFSRTYVLRGIVSSDEFAGRCSDAGMKAGEIGLSEVRDLNPDITLSVGQMYSRVLGTGMPGDMVNSMVQSIADGNLTLQIAAFRIADTAEFAALNSSDEDYVRSLFRGLADREASDEEMQEYLGALSGGSSRADILRKLAASEIFYELNVSRNLRNKMHRIGSNFKLDGTWYHFEPSGRYYPVENETLLKLLNRTEEILSSGDHYRQIYNFCINDSRYKYIETTKTIEEIEDIGWTFFADYAMENYRMVCYYMAAQMDILLEQSGYRCRVVHSVHGSGDHYWNQVYIDGKWKNFDITNWYYDYTWEQMVAAGDYVLVDYVRPEYK